ncbi:MAG: hypothetical protein JNK64_12645 [Myxococcales bacterium]|nr:hypothetical protein [Myxococcales bacterium]
MRWLRLLAVVCVLAAGDAHAAMMAHYDLAGLTLESDAIVVATRTPAANRTSSYHVTRAIRGPIAVGSDLVLDDGLYATEGHTIEPEVVVFLHRVDAGGWYITSSGLRVVEAGKVFRFEQWDNPGGFTMVPQGHDPADQWHATGAPIDRATFDRELVAALARADGVAAALAITDPARRRAAALALAPPVGASRPSMGFYRDEVTARLAAGLAAAGDLAAALDVMARDRSGIAWRAPLATPAALIAVAQDPTAPVERRVEALRAVRAGALFADAIGVAAVLTLVDAPEAAVRAAAIGAAASVWGWSGGDRAQAARNRALRRLVGRALARRFAVEQDGAVLAALAAAYQGRPLPARRGGSPIAATVAVVADGLHVEARCLRRARAQHPELLADGAPASGWVSVTCGAEQYGRGAGIAPSWTVGAHRLELRVVVDRAPVVVPLGTLTADRSGELTLTPP